MEPDLRARLAGAFRWIDPGPHSGHLVGDRSGWWRDAALLDALGPALAGLFPDARPTVVVSPAATGYLLGPLVARALGVGFVEAVKDGGPVPADPVTWGTTPADYRGRRLRVGVRTRLIGAGDRVLLVDDWVVTGAQVHALYGVLGALGAEPVGAAVVVAEGSPELRARLRVRSLLTGADLGP